MGVMSRYRRVRFFETQKVESLPLLWKQCSWFLANLKTSKCSEFRIE